VTRRCRSEDEDEWEEDKAYGPDRSDDEDHVASPSVFRRAKVKKRFLPALEVVRMGRRTVSLCWKSQGVGWGFLLAIVMVSQAIVPVLMPVLAAFLLHHQPHLVAVAKEGEYLLLSRRWSNESSG